MNKVKIILAIILVTVMSHIAGGCTTEAEEKGQLENIKWTLESYGERGNTQTILESTVITATFNSEESQVSGSAGCNSYFGEYQVTGKKLTVKQLANTEMYCMEPEGVMEQESEYLKLLMKVDSYEINDGTLVIKSDDNLLVFSIK